MSSTGSTWRLIAGQLCESEQGSILPSLDTVLPALQRAGNMLIHRPLLRSARNASLSSGRSQHACRHAPRGELAGAKVNDWCYDVLNGRLVAQRSLPWFRSQALLDIKLQWSAHWLLREAFDTTLQQQISEKHHWLGTLPMSELARGSVGSRILMLCVV